VIALDALRGAAILTVLLHHGANRDRATAWYHAGPLRWPLWYFKEFGWAGVDLFFVLSGYLIGGLLFSELMKTGRLRIGRFLLRREAKILPPYLAYLGLAWWLSRSGLLPEDVPALTWTDTWPSLLFVGNYLGLPPMREHVWSLAVEEHFYVSLPLVLGGLAWLGGLRPVPWLLGAVVIASPLGRVAAVLRGADPWHLYLRTHHRLDGLALGVLLAYLAAFRADAFARLSRRPAWLAAAGCLLMWPVATAAPFAPVTLTVGYSLVALGCAAFLLAALAAPGPAPAPVRWLAAIGAISYPVYLLHIDLGMFPAWRLEPMLASLPASAAWAIGTGVYLALALASGWLMHRLVERPALRLRDQLRRRGTRCRRGPGRGGASTAASAVSGIMRWVS
jgi:peptidoglycan/LPS O-acetylase OafA/YrhL